MRVAYWSIFIAIYLIVRMTFPLILSFEPQLHFTHIPTRTHTYKHTHICTLTQTHTHTHTHNYSNVHISFLGAISEHLTVTENHMETLTPDSLTMWTAVLIPSSVPLMKVWVSLLTVTITVTFTVTVTITNNNHNHL